MEIMEIILLIVGVIILAASFFLPGMRDADMAMTKELAQSEIKDLVAAQMEQIRQQVDDTVEEAVTYAMEKTERSLERVSNEKIMAVNEYSDTVLAEINKNHQEVMFLYDMLNNKHASLKNTVTVVKQKAKEAEAIAKEAFHSLQPEVIEVQKEEVAPPEEPILQQSVPESTTSRQQRNETILAMYKLGKSKIQIAKAMGLGIGEVELVIGLFRE